MMRSKRFLLAVLALATAMGAADAGAQTIAYRNLLQFDLQSFRSQATGGIFQDDVDRLADATRLLEIDGTRIWTNFSNLSDPATLGDNLITYSMDQMADFASNDPRPGIPNSPSSGADIFDSGSYLGGWAGKYDQDSDYTFHILYQRSGHKAMFEDLEDGDLGGPFGFSTDAEYSGEVLAAFDDGTGGDTAGDGDVDREISTVSDLVRFDDRSATRIDIGGARELAGTDWSVGGRIFWRNDKIERNAEGTTTQEFRQKFADNGPLEVTGRTVTEYSGSMEDAFKMREAGVSLNADWHPGGWSLNSRVDVFGLNYTNPSTGTSLPSSRLGSSSLPWLMSGNVPAIETTTNETVVTNNAGFNPNPLVSPGGDQTAATLTNTSFSTSPFGLGPYRGGLALESVDDERTGIGFAGKLELDRPAWGGDTRTWAGLNYRPVDIDATIVLAERSGSTFWWNDGTNGDQMATVTNLDQMNTIDWNGDATNTVLEAGSKWWRKLSNRVEMGLGIILTRSTYEQKFRETNSQEIVQNRFDDGFGTLGGNELEGSTVPGAGGGVWNEQQTLTQTTTVTDIQDETRETDIRLPVGAQFNITKKIKWQMGVQHKIAYWTRELSRTVAADQDGQTVTTFTDYANSANDTVTYSAGQQTSRDETITDEDEYNQTTYWYGLEWLVNDTAQFNINGFFDTYSDNNVAAMFEDDDNDIFDVDFFRNLAVSLTFMFD